VIVSTLVLRLTAAESFVETRQCTTGKCPKIRCQAKFLTSRHVRMHRAIFYTSP